MITIPGFLAIKTIHGRNGDFNVGRLSTSIGEFVTKAAELEQYTEGKYEGDFSILRIAPSMYTTGGRMVIEMRAELAGMSLSNLDPLTKDEAQGLSGQEVDPIDEQAATPQPVLSAAPNPLPEAEPAVAESPAEEAVPQDATAKPSSVASAAPPSGDQEDASLFGSVWPLGPIVKLDSTVDRLVLRKQRARLDKLGYSFDYTSQEWSEPKAA